MCVPSRNCFKFFSQVTATAIALIVSLTMMIVLGFNDPTFPFWQGVFSLTIGVFIPSPEYGDAVSDGAVAPGAPTAAERAV